MVKSRWNLQKRCKKELGLPRHVLEWNATRQRRPETKLGHFYVALRRRKVTFNARESFYVAQIYRRAEFVDICVPSPIAAQSVASFVGQT